MKRIIYLLLYLVFLVSSILYGSLYIGPVTPRQVMSVVFFFICLYEKFIFLDKYMKLYICFIFFYVLACVTTGGVEIAIRNIFSYYFVAYVGYQSTTMIITKYRGAKFLIISFIILFGLDAIVSMIQMWNRPLSYWILDTLNISIIDDNLERAELYDLDTLAGMAVPGIVGSVINGYVLSISCALALYNKEAKLKLKNIILLLFFLFSVFIVQERTALLSSAFISLFLIIKLYNSSEERNKVKWLFLLISIIIVCIIIGPSVYNSFIDDGLRYSESKFNLREDARFAIWKGAIDYIVSCPIGGIYNYMDIYSKMPHNFFLNAFIYGGFAGGIFIMIIFIKQLSFVFSIFKRKINRANINIMVFSAAFMTCVLNSLTHNISIVDGSIIIWIIWGAIVSTDFVNKTNKY